MTMKVGAISVDLLGNASSMEKAAAQGVQSLGRVSKGASDLGQSLAKVTAAEELATIAARKLGTDMAVAGDKADAASKKLKTAKERLAELQQGGMRAAGAISAMSGALGTADGQIGKFGTALMAVAGSFAMGGPLMGGIALVGTALGALASHWQGVEKAAKDAHKEMLDAAKGVADSLGKRESAALEAMAGGGGDADAAKLNRLRAEASGLRQDLAAIGGLDAPGFFKGLFEPANVSAAREALKDVTAQIAEMEERLGHVIVLEGGVPPTAASSKGRGGSGPSARSMLNADAYAPGDTIGLAGSLAGIAMVADGLDEVDIASVAFTATLSDLQDQQDQASVAAAANSAAYAASLEAEAEAKRALTAQNQDAAAGIMTGAALGGSVSLGTIGSAIGMAAGGPMGAAVGGAISEMIQELINAITGGMTKVLDSAGGQAVMGAAQSGMKNAAAAGGLAGAVPLLGPVLGPLIGAVVFLGTLFLELSMATQAFADIQAVIGGALEAMIEPLGAVWVAFQPIVGLFVLLAQATAPLVGLLANGVAAAITYFVGAIVDGIGHAWPMFVALSVIGSLLQGAFTAVVQNILAFSPAIAMMNQLAQWQNAASSALVDGYIFAATTLIMAVRGFATWVAAFINHLEAMFDNEIDIKGEGAMYDLRDSADAALAALSQPPDGQAAFNDALDGLTAGLDLNTEALNEFSEELTNIPSGYRVPYYDASDPGSNPASGGGPRGGGVGARAGNGLVVNGDIVIQASSSSVFDSINREAQRRFGRNRPLGGPGDEEN